MVMLELFQYDFVVRGFAAGIIIAIIAPLIGIFLVVRRYALMADTLAHVSLVGVAFGLLSKINPAITALVTAIVAALGMEWLRQSRKVFGESVLALFLSGGLALAIVLISYGKGLNTNLFGFLFGSIATVSSNDLLVMGITALIVVGVVVLFFRELFFVSFNEELAEANGLPVARYNMLTVVLAAITVSLSIRIIGVLLIGALMVIPVVTALQFRKSFQATFVPEKCGEFQDLQLLSARVHNRRFRPQLR